MKKTIDELLSEMRRNGLIEPLLSYKAAATILDCSPSKVQKMVLAGELPFVKVGNLVRILREDLATAIAKEGLSSIRRSNLTALSTQGGVYFLFSPNMGLIKIGMATNFRKRIPVILTMNAEPLEIMATITDESPRRAEAWFHRTFRKNRVRFEWFSVTREQIEAAITEWKAR